MIDWNRLAAIAYDAYMRSFGDGYVHWSNLTENTKAGWIEAVKAAADSGGAPEQRTKRQLLEPGMLLRYKGNLYQIEGVYLGGVGQVNLIGLSCLNQKPGCTGGVDHEQMYVPEDILLASLDSAVGPLGSAYMPVVLHD